MSSSCSLHIAVDADLSAAFDGLTSAPSNAALFSHLPPRTTVRAERRTNAVAQTVVLTLHSLTPNGLANTGQGASRDEQGAVYAVVVLDAQQVTALLSTATAHRCPPHPSGAGPLGWYLDAVVEGLVEEKKAALQAHRTSGANPDKSDVACLSSSSSLSTSCSTSSKAPMTVLRKEGESSEGLVLVVHLSLVLAPNATALLDGLPGSHATVTAKDAATLFSAATAWCAAQQPSRPVNKERVALSVDKSAELVHTNGEGTNSCHLRCEVSLDLCTTVAQPQQALQVVAALASKLLKNWSLAVAATSVTTTPVAASALNSDGVESSNFSTCCDSSRSDGRVLSSTPSVVTTDDLRDVRPDTQRKCIPTDFHALYTSMLTEVSSFSERKTMAAVTAFPTLCHLLEYVDQVTSAGATGGGAAGASSSNTLVSSTATTINLPQAVYSTNFGEQRSWNVLNDAIVEALITEYGNA